MSNSRHGCRPVRGDESKELGDTKGEMVAVTDLVGRPINFKNVEDVLRDVIAALLEHETLLARVRKEADLAREQVVATNAKIAELRPSADEAAELRVLVAQEREQGTKDAHLFRTLVGALTSRVSALEEQLRAVEAASKQSVPAPAPAAPSSAPLSRGASGRTAGASDLLVRIEALERQAKEQRLVQGQLQVMEQPRSDSDDVRTAAQAEATQAAMAAVEDQHERRAEAEQREADADALRARVGEIEGALAALQLWQQAEALDKARGRQAAPEGGLGGGAATAVPLPDAAALAASAAAAAAAAAGGVGAGVGAGAGAGAHSHTKLGGAGGPAADRGHGDGRLSGPAAPAGPLPDLRRVLHEFELLRQGQLENQGQLTTLQLQVRAFGAPPPLPRAAARAAAVEGSG